MTDLLEEFQKRFSDIHIYSEAIEFCSSPFGIIVYRASEKFQMELIDLKCNSDLKKKFSHVIDITKFYKSYLPKEECPQLISHASTLVALRHKILLKNEYYKK
jgi:hypothetical protein